MGKPDNHPLKDVTIIQNDSKPCYRTLELFADLSSPKGKLASTDKKDSAKKRKFNETETVSMTGIKNSGHINLEPSINKKHSNQKIASSLYLSGSNRKIARCKQEDSSSQSTHEPNYVSASEPKLAFGPILVLMSCLNCYVHVMVSDSNPKCPKCNKGDCLLDIYR